MNKAREHNEHEVRAVKVLRFLERNFEKIAATFFLCSMVGLLSAVVFARFALNKGFGTAIELDRMAFIWLVYIAAGFAAREGAHIRLAAASSIWPRKIRRHVRLLADIIWLAFNIIIIKGGIDVVHSMFIYRYESPALGWSMAYVYMLVPISFTLISIRVIQRNIQEFMQQRESS